MDTLKSFYSGFFKEFRNNWKGTSCWKLIRYSFKSFLKTFYWQHRYAWQRAWRGYDSVDIFNMNDNLREKMIVMLEEYDKTRSCLFTKPLSGEDSQNINIDDFVMTNEETSKIIQKMVLFLSASDEQFYYDENYDFKPGYDYKKVSSECDKNMVEFFEMLKMYWNQLWD